MTARTSAQVVEIRWLRELRREVELEVERRGGFAGRVRPEQRRWSWTLDVLQAIEQELA